MAICSIARLSKETLLTKVIKLCNYLCISRKFRANDHSKSNKSLSKRMGENISLQINFICLISEFCPSGYSITDVILNQNHSALVCFCILTTMWLLFNSFSNKNMSQTANGMLQNMKNFLFYKVEVDV